MRVLSLPARHPYMSKFNTGEIEFVNPETDYFSSGKYQVRLLNILHPPNTYDVVHIHFSFDRVPIRDFEVLLKYFQKSRKPLVWTCHSRESQRVKNLGGGKYQKLLFQYADQVISPTEGCSRWLKSTFGTHEREVKVIPLGYMADPDEVRRIAKKIKKKRNIFTYLIGDFRENKEVFQSITTLLQCNALKRVKLQLIFKPINLHLNFLKLADNPRVLKISLPEIPGELIIEAFLASHAIILPYKWGTHSGQIELAKDCGCHVVASNVGYYKEQWEKVYLWNVSDGKVSDYPTRYTKALLETYHEPPLKPAGIWRNREFENIFQEHLTIYRTLLKESAA